MAKLSKCEKKAIVGRTRERTSSIYTGNVWLKSGQQVPVKSILICAGCKSWSIWVVCPI